MDETPDFVMVQRTLTCHVPDCPNEDVPITMEVPEDCTTFVCGPCGLPIFDVTQPADPGATPIKG